jgi:hypothetical protein
MHPHHRHHARDVSNGHAGGGERGCGRGYDDRTGSARERAGARRILPGHARHKTRTSKRYLGPRSPRPGAPAVVVPVAGRRYESSRSSLRSGSRSPPPRSWAWTTPLATSRGTGRSPQTSPPRSPPTRPGTACSPTPPPGS